MSAIYPHKKISWRNVRKLREKLWFVLFPEKCTQCDKSGSILCATCLEEAFHAFEEENILAIFRYSHTGIKKILWSQKFRGNERVAGILAPFLYDTLLGKITEETIHFGSEYEKEKILLIPIPLSKKRMRKRGYNQAQKLTEAIAKIDHGIMLEENTDLLFKNRETLPQTKMKNKKERLQNLAGCFSISDPTKIAERKIILIDDIITTGATFREAERTLRESGAEKIICLAVAH